MDKKTYYKYKTLKMVEKLCGFPRKSCKSYAAWQQ